jgi:hypothetical protein
MPVVLLALALFTIFEVVALLSTLVRGLFSLLGRRTPG